MMKKSLLTFMLFVSMFFGVFGLSINSANAQSLDTCTGDDSMFLGLPKWYKYVDRRKEDDKFTKQSLCVVKVKGYKDVLLIVAAIVELLIRLSSILAIGIIIYGGVQYIISQGSPDKTKEAQSTIINSVIGLAITIIAASVVSFIAGRF